MFKKLEAGWLDFELKDEFGSATFTATYMDDPLYKLTKFIDSILKEIHKNTDNPVVVYLDGESTETYIVYHDSDLIITTISSTPKIKDKTISIYKDIDMLVSEFFDEVDDEFIDVYCNEFYDEENKDKKTRRLINEISKLKNLVSHILKSQGRV